MGTESARLRAISAFKAAPIAVLSAVLVGAALMVMGDASAADPIGTLRAEREAYIEHFRIHGRQQPERARALEARLQAVVQQAEGPLEASALYELATMQRLTSRFDDAIVTYHRAAESAAELGLDDVAFDAWIGVARAHAYGTRDHGAAAEAFRRAVEIAGSDPTPKQGYEIAD